MNFDTPLLLYNTFGNGNFIVAPDLRDGRPPEEAESENSQLFFERMLAFLILLRLFGWPAVPEVRRHYHPATITIKQRRCVKKN